MIKSGSSNIRKFQFFEVINDPKNIIKEKEEKEEKENPSKEKNK